MASSDLALIKAFRKESQEFPPFWFMRQAGRYMAEYREVRASMDGFLNLCYSPEKAAEVTLQPIAKFGMPASIIFSDILVVPQAMGVDLRFAEGEGPILSPVNTDAKLAALLWNPASLAPVYKAIRITRAKLPESTALIGFAGAPWTLACYMVQGKSDKDFHKVRGMAITKPAFFTALMDMLTLAVIEHLKAQIRSGVQAVQLFDSWAGVLSAEEFQVYCIEPAAKIVAALKAEFPDVPVIGFPRQAGLKYMDYAVQTKVDGISIDAGVPLSFAQKLQEVCVVQGNLDPVILASSKEATLAQAKRILDAMGNKSFVFNLGHGILPHTPVENVAALCALLRGEAK
ncbi:MAG: uroporphyrinogen decarboxylase [Rickettsiales bacterium]|nr:uroporphyrinogen decarboxylase [Rickettsiales bacterium]